jgi:MOSC domain-containing protein YiiM
MGDALAGTVVAVSSDPAHRFSKLVRPHIRLIEDFGIEGDAHAGRLVKHRYDARRTPDRPNLRQIHLIQYELFPELEALGFVVQPGQLGENVTTRHLDLLRLPLTCRLHLGASAVVELTGLRTPCDYIDRFRKGLKRALIVRDQGVTFRAGVLGVVRHGGNIAPGDRVEVELPRRPWRPLPAL